MTMKPITVAIDGPAGRGKILRRQGGFPADGH